MGTVCQGFDHFSDFIFLHHLVLVKLASSSMKGNSKRKGCLTSTIILDEANMDWSPQTNYHRAQYYAGLGRSMHSA